MDDRQGDLNMNSGSRWHRWDPHIHAPGTVLNNQFKGETSWEDYLTAIEASSPPIRAIGITDYYSIECYEKVREFKNLGRLAECDLIFPNVEMRLAIGTVKGHWVNAHLLVDPEDTDHIIELKRFLSRITFKAHNESFSCTKEDLIRLGKKIDGALSENAALRRGSEQFKTSLDVLRDAYDNSAWARKNILVAVSGSESDGSSGVRDGADATLRQEIEKFAHVIFASSAAQREFWLGQRGATEAELRARYGGLKPCLHGSDAHDQKSVGVPNERRFSWVKGAAAFDTLRQTCIDPAGRAFVGNDPPIRATPSQVIDNIEINDASWAVTKRIELNPGLVAIIGARGSGKTALADLIALGCDATSDRLSPASFLTRAQDLLRGASVSLTWHSGRQTVRQLDQSDEGESAEFPRARYLSQQFVEALCSATGMTDALLSEIERVIFEAHSFSDRDGAIDFDELLSMKASLHRDSRSREEYSLADISDRINIDLEKERHVQTVRKQVEEKSKLVEGYTKDRARLVSKGGETRIQRLASLNDAAEKVREHVRRFANQEQSLLSLKSEVGNLRLYGAPEALRKSQDRHAASRLTPEDWQQFLLEYRGDVDRVLSSQLSSAQKSMKAWKGDPHLSTSPPDKALISDETDLAQLPLSLLEAEIARLQKLVNVDQETAKKFAALSKRIVEESSALERLKERLTDCEGAKARTSVARKQRMEAYTRVFEAIVGEEAVLRELYKPLMARLASGETVATVGKLSFSVSREADVNSWAEAGEELLDLRRQGPLRGRGALQQIAEKMLKPAWENGDPVAVSSAMEMFVNTHREALLEHSRVPKADQLNYREWAKNFAKWLYGTGHIAIHYSIDYDGIDIRKLSPGTRGIVLLLLYLALDESDDRPLIIDQPEENLDPKSIFEELVGLFLTAKQKRQVILVTHNANLVVNTDADQVIVANAGPHRPGALPPISYLSGGLESAHIRTAVCNILEGGERAFQERARRLRVHLDR